MLGLMELAMIPIPLVFYRYGHKIREKSVLIRKMREDKEKLDSKKRKAVDRQDRLRRKSEDGKEVAELKEKEVLEI